VIPTPPGAFLGSLANALFAHSKSDGGEEAREHQNEKW
jgi:hypothetical protein